MIASVTAQITSVEPTLQGEAKFNLTVNFSTDPPGEKGIVMVKRGGWYGATEDPNKENLVNEMTLYREEHQSGEDIDITIYDKMLPLPRHTLSSSEGEPEVISKPLEIRYRDKNYVVLFSVDFSPLTFAYWVEVEEIA